MVLTLPGSVYKWLKVDEHSDRALKMKRVDNPVRSKQIIYIRPHWNYIVINFKSDASFVSPSLATL